MPMICVKGREVVYVRGESGREAYDSVDGDDFAKDDAARVGLLALASGEKEKSTRTDLIKFLVVMRGALTPPPSMEAPVTRIPLRLYI